MNTLPDSIFQGDILVAGGTPTGRKLLVRNLKEAGYKVRTAESGRSALRQARTRAPDLILLDTVLPDEGGFETHRRLQADEKTRTIPVVFIGSSKNDSAEVFRTPGVDFLRRPFSAEELLARIRPHLILAEERKMFVAGPTVIFKWKAEAGWPVEYVSPNVESQFGYRPADFLSRRIPFASIVHPDDLPRVAQEVNFHTEAKVPCFEQEYRIARADGEYRWLFDFTVVIRDPDGAVTHYHGYVQDVTGRRKAEEALRMAHAELERRVEERTVDLVAANARLRLEIAERMRVEENWKTANRRLEDIVDFLPDATFIIDRDKKIIAWNRAMEEMTGVSNKEIIGRDHRNSTNPFYGETRPYLMNLLDKEDRELAEKYDYIRRKGTTLYAEVFAPGLFGNRGAYVWAIASPLLDKDGRIVGAIESIRDITEYKRVEADLHQQILFLQQLIDAVPSPIFFKDKNGSYTGCNLAFEESVGRGRGQIIGKSVHEIAPPELAEMSFAKDTELLAHPGTQTYEAQVRHADGTLHDVIFKKATFIDSRGNSEGIVGIIVDITERKKVEEALKANEIKYRALFEDSRDVVFISSPEGRFLDINPAGLELFGFSDKQEFLQADALDFYVDPRAREDYLRLMQERGFVKDYRIELKSRSGMRLSVLESSTVVRNESGQIVAFRGILHDVSESEKLQQQLMQSQKMEAIGRLAGGIAHDFNNLLTAIIGNAELMQHMLGNQPAALDRLRSIRETADRAARLTRQLLTLSRKQIVEPRELNVNRIIRGMENILVRLLGEDIRCQYRLDAPTPWVRIDPSQFEQILLNLAVNAREAMAKGGALFISTRNIGVDEGDADLNPGVTPGRYVQVSVSDTGEGIPMEILPKIFDPFFTTKPKGTGLGLSTVYGIVKQAGGYILARSEPGRGTTVDVFLPEVFVEKRNSPEKTEFPLVTMPVGRETVLAVEDEPAILQLIIAVLSGLGYSVLSAKDGAQAIPLAETHTDAIDLLLTDVILPGIRGPQLADELRTKIPDLLVLFTSGYTDERISYAEILEKKAHFLAKPFTPSQLAKKVRAVLDHADDEM